jgi:hypothetical protein
MEDAAATRVVSKSRGSRWTLGLEERLGLDEPMSFGEATDNDLRWRTLLNSDSDLEWDLTVGEALGEISPHSPAIVSCFAHRRCGEGRRDGPSV